METSQRKSPVVVLIIGISVTVAVLSGLYARANLAAATEDRIPLTVETQTIVRSSQLMVDHRFSGRVEPTQQVLLASELAGKIKTVSVNEGDTVKAGDTLLTLDTALLDAERKRLLSSLSGLDAQKSLAARRLVRQQDLQTQGFSAEDTIDEIQTNLKLIAAEQQTLMADIERIDIQLEKSVVKAPFNASIQQRFADVGAVISPGAALLDLMEAGIGEIKVGVPVDIARDIQVGDQHAIEVRGDGGLAEVVSVAPAVNRITQTVAVRLIIRDMDFRIGEFVNLRFGSLEPASGFWIPNTALVEDERGLWSVFVVGADKIVKKYSASVLHADSQRVFIDIDEKESLNVIVTGLNRIAPGMRVEI